MPTAVTVAHLRDVPPGTGIVRVVAGKPVAIFNVGGTLYAIDDACPHAGAPLSDGDVDGTVVTCLWHGWRFRLTDGVWADAPKGKVRVGCYPVAVVGDEVVVTLP